MIHSDELSSLTISPQTSGVLRLGRMPHYPFEVIFIRPRHDYDSYHDFWRLVELSGYTIAYHDAIDLHRRDVTYIAPMINAEFNFEGATARIVHWNMEWLEDRTFPILPGIRETWTADKAHAKATNLRYVPVGSHKDFAHNARRSPDAYDVATIAYQSGRRQHITYLLNSNGVTTAPNRGEFYEREKLLNTSRLVLHVHQTEAQVISPLRFAVAAAYRLPLLSEQCEDPGIYADAVPFSEYDNLLAHVKSWLDYGDLEGKAQALHQLLCEEYTFRKCIEAAL